jgi:hypothetical protein
MKILFLHGWQSTPGGIKPTYQPWRRVKGESNNEGQQE